MIITQDWCAYDSGKRSRHTHTSTRAHIHRQTDRQTHTHTHTHIHTYTHARTLCSIPFTYWLVLSRSLFPQARSARDPLPRSGEDEQSDCCDFPPARRPTPRRKGGHAVSASSQPAVRPTPRRRGEHVEDACWLSPVRPTPRRRGEHVEDACWLSSVRQTPRHRGEHEEDVCWRPSVRPTPRRRDGSWGPELHTRKERVLVTSCLDQGVCSSTLYSLGRFTDWLRHWLID